MIIRADILIMSVLHTEALRDHPKLCKSKSLIKMSCMDITCHNCIKLPMSYTALAQYLSVDRSAMMREIKNLSDEGVIKRDGRNVELR